MSSLRGRVQRDRRSSLILPRNEREYVIVKTWQRKASENVQPSNKLASQMNESTDNVTSQCFNVKVRIFVNMKNKRKSRSIFLYNTQTFLLHGLQNVCISMVGFNTYVIK